MDYTSASCSACDDLQFQPYSDPGCEFLEERLMSLFLVLCGVSVNCWTDETELDALVAGKQGVVVGRIAGTIDPPSANTIDTPFSRTPSQIVRDHDHSITFQVPFRMENYDFWNYFKPSASLGAAAYADYSGTVYEIPGSPELSVSYGSLNGIKVINGVLTWTAKELERPFKALPQVFAV